jgi:hypothetical protein
LSLSQYRGGAIVTIFSAYFDASGHPDQQDVLTVAGYAAAVENWIRFEGEWAEILRDAGLNSFHTTEFMSSQGEFGPWKGRTDKRRSFTEKLTQCIERNCAKFFRVSLFVPDYELVNSEYMLRETVGRPYAVCATLATFSLRQWAQELGALATLLYFFEDGDKDKGDFEKRHKQLYGRNPSFLKKDQTPAFQAVDLNAWKMRTALHECNKPTHTTEIGNDLLRSVSILEGVSKEAGVLNRYSFRAFCERYGVAKR